MKRLLLPFALGVTTLISAWFFLNRPSQSAAINEDKTTDARGSAASRPFNSASTSTSTWSASPFGPGAPVTEKVAALPLRALERQKKMTERGYATPPEYYTMALGKLQAMAAQGDADAMLQLAEQYLHESRSLVTDPDYPTNGDTNLLGKAYLAAALDAGRSQAAALLSQRYFKENNIADAYAWKLMTERFGNGHVPDIDVSQFTYMNEEEKRAANAKYMAMAATTNKVRAQNPARR